eukprot:g13202.t1
MSALEATSNHSSVQEGVCSPLPASPFRKDILRDRVVIITGGATGIGFALAQCFGAHGARVAIMSRRLPVIQAAVAKLKEQGVEAMGCSVDVRDMAKCSAAVEQVTKEWGRLDFLINNAAGNFMCSAEDLTAGGMSTVLGIDLQGSFHMSRAALPWLQQAGRARGAVIINITATLQDLATPFQTHAACAKAGIDVLTQQLGVEWAEYGIRVIGLAPGGIEGTVGGPGGRVFSNNENKASSVGAGKVTVDSMAQVKTKADSLRALGVPAGRWGRVEDIALAAVFMCSDGAPWITATRLTIDGGSQHRVTRFVEMKKQVAAKSREQKQQFKGQGGVASPAKAKL